MGVVAGLVLGAGLLSIWFSFFEPRPPRRRVRAGWLERTQDLLVHAGAPTVTPMGLALASMGVGLAAGVLTLAVTGISTVALCFTIIATGAPALLVRARARKRRMRLRAVWPDVIDDIVSAIRAGLSLPEALIAIGERGPEEVRGEFRRFTEDYRATGRFVESLDALKARLADPVADRICEALRLAREVGGTDLGVLLRTLARMLREDLRTRGEVEARQSWTVAGARLAVAAPWAVLLLVSMRSDGASAYGSAMGLLVLGGGGFSCLLAYALMVRLGRLPEEGRILR